MGVQNVGQEPLGAALDRRVSVGKNCDKLGRRVVCNAINAIAKARSAVTSHRFTKYCIPRTIQRRQPMTKIRSNLDPGRENFETAKKTQGWTKERVNSQEKEKRKCAIKAHNQVRYDYLWSGTSVLMITQSNKP